MGYGYCTHLGYQLFKNDMKCCLHEIGITPTVELLEYLTDNMWRILHHTLRANYMAEALRRREDKEEDIERITGILPLVDWMDIIENHGVLDI